MNTFKFKSVNKVISLLLAVCFIFTNNVCLAADTLRVPFISKTKTEQQAEQERLTKTAWQAFKLHYKLETVYPDIQESLKMLHGFIPKDMVWSIHSDTKLYTTEKAEELIGKGKAVIVRTEGTNGIP